MVRRGSPVRVRKRALQKPRIECFLLRIYLQVLQCAAGYGALMEPSGRKRSRLVEFESRGSPAADAEAREPKEETRAAQCTSGRGATGRGRVRDRGARGHRDRAAGPAT